MKTSKIFCKIVALVIVAATLVCMLASCSSSKKLMTLEMDGKEYAISAAEYKTFMTIVKMNVYLNSLMNSTAETYFWKAKFDDEQTNEQYYSEYVQKVMKTTLVEKYLFEKYDLKLSDATLAGYKENMKKDISSIGGAGSYKQYYGYTAKQYYDFYKKSADMSSAIIDHLYEGDNALYPVTDDEKNAYYKEHYSGFMIIYLDMNNEIAKDEDGNYIGLDSSNVEYKLSITNVDGNVKIENLGRVDGKEMKEDTEVNIVSFKTKALSEDDVATKSNLPELIIDEIDGGADFKELALKYSDDYTSYLYENGVFISDSGYIVNNSDVMDPVRKLEIGENTDAISISDGKYVYIVKRIELEEKAYDSEEYENLFSSYSEDVMYDKYDKFVDEYFDKIVVDEDAVAEYTMASTFLSKYVDDFYNYYLSLFGGSSN